MSKVPEVTICFWLIKVLTTAMGEATSDFLAHRINPIIAVGCTGIVLSVSLAVQFTMRRYVPWIYWTGIVMVSIFGTMAADVLHVGLGVPYLASTAFFVVVLAVIFGVWYSAEKTLSIHSIYTWRREFFYWATVIATFALGTAAGDMTAVTLHLGYLTSGLMFAAVIAVPAVAYRFGLNPVFSFWFAYVITRPLGASFADWAGVSRGRGGLALGTGPVSLALTAAIVVFVGYLTVGQKGTGRGSHRRR